MKNNKHYLYELMVLLLLCLVFFFSCKGTPVPDKETGLEDIIPVDPAITIGKLKNGLTYYIRPNKKPENRAELRLAVKAGSINEDDDQKGLAHFLEHMAFNGTENFKKQEIVSFLESLGMRFGPELNAYTSYEETIYMLQIPTENTEVLETGLQILSEWAHAMLIEEEEVEKERGVIIEEWRLGRGADTRIRDKQFPVLFKDSRFAERRPIGDIKVIEKADTALLRRFYSDWYRPDLMAVVAIGDFDTLWMEEQIQKYFTKMNMPENPRSQPDREIPGHDNIRFTVVTDPEKTTSQVKLYIKFPYDYEGRIRDYRENIVKYLFGNMLNARLSEITKDPKAPFIHAYSGGAGIIGNRELFAIGADVKAGRIRESFTVLITEAERAKRFGFTKGELDRAKKSIMAWMTQAYRERENTESADFASEYIRHFTDGESIPGIAFEYELYDTYLTGIGLEEVNDLAGQEITYKNMVVMISGPEKEESIMPGEQELARVFEEARTRDITPYTDTETDKPLIAETPKEKEILEQSKLEEPGLISLTLPNGVKVVLKQTDFTNDEILFTAISPGGYSLVKDENYIPAITAVSIIEKGGLGDFTLNELEKKLAGVNLEVTPWISELYEGIRGKTTADDLETCFKLIYLYFTSPRKDQDAFRAYREEWKTEIENRSSSPELVFWDTVWWVLSREHFRRRPYSLDMLGEMDLDTSYSFYKDRFKDAGDFTFFFVGDFSVDRIEPLIKTYLANLPSAGRVETWRDSGIDPPDGVLTQKVYKGLEPKSQVLIVFAGETEWTPDRTLEINALQEILTIRLREIVREEEGGTYSIWAHGELKKYPDEEYVMYIGFGCAPEKAEELSSIVLKEVEIIIENGPTKSELDKVREILKREYETNVKENNFWLQSLQAYHWYNLDPGRILTLPSRVDRLTGDAIRKAAEEYLKLSDYTRFVLLPEGG